MTEFAYYMAFLFTEVIPLSVRQKGIECTVYPGDEVCYEI